MKGKGEMEHDRVLKECNSENEKTLKYREREGGRERERERERNPILS